VNCINSFVKEEDGVAVVEYALFAAMIAGLIIAMVAVARIVGSTFSNMLSQLSAGAR